MVTLRYSILLFILIELLNVYGYVPTDGWHFDLMLMLQYVPMFTLTPRFILSIRELYALDVQGRRGGGVDTGFGLSAIKLVGRYLKELVPFVLSSVKNMSFTFSISPIATMQRVPTPGVQLVGFY